MADDKGDKDKGTGFMELLMASLAKGGWFVIPRRMAAATLARDLTTSMGKLLASGQPVETLKAYEQVLGLSFFRMQNVGAILSRTREMIEATPTRSLGPVDPGFVSRFVSDGADVSEEMIQEIYSQILYAEVTEPGTCSKAVLACLRYMDTNTAEVFNRLHPLILRATEDQMFLLPFSGEAEKFYTARRFSYGDFLRLDELGIIRTPRVYLGVESMPVGTSAGALVHYQSGVITAEVVESTDPLYVSAYPLTHGGSELARALADIRDEEFRHLVQTKLLRDFVIPRTGPSVRGFSSYE